MSKQECWLWDSRRCCCCLQLLQLLLLLLLVFVSETATAFSASPPPSPVTPSSVWKGLEDAWKSLLDTSPNKNKASSRAIVQKQQTEKVRLLKQRLLDTCREKDVDATATTKTTTKEANSMKEKRAKVEAILNELTTLSSSSISSSSSSMAARNIKNPLLQKEWALVWTTEKEINFFLDMGLSNQVTQTITSGNVLINNIAFVKGGYFGVTGKLSVPQSSSTTTTKDPSKNSDNGSDVSASNDNKLDDCRTNFEFTSATLDVGKWGTYQIPPVGKGWFDTLYLDEELRVDINSRNDLLVCVPVESSSS